MPDSPQFYFVHWLTDLAGAEGAPLSGAEKFVVKFPHVVLSSFIRSFPIVQTLAHCTETELMENFLCEWWPSDELGPVPEGPEGIALMRLAAQVQTPSAARLIVEAFNSLPSDDWITLAREMACTGIHGQTYKRCPIFNGGPAFLVYYSPAWLRQSVGNPLAALRVLAEVYRAARTFYPFNDAHANDRVIIYIDMFKEAGAAADLLSKLRVGDGSCWMLVYKGMHEATVQLLSLVHDDVPPLEARKALEISSVLKTADRQM